MSEKTLLQYCPECRTGLDAVSPVTSEAKSNPKPGDVSVCFYCGTVLCYDEGGAIVRATRDDIDKLDPEDAFILGGIVGAICKRNREKTGGL